MKKIINPAVLKEAEFTFGRGARAGVGHGQGDGAISGAGREAHLTPREAGNPEDGMPRSL